MRKVPVILLVLLPYVALSDILQKWFTYRHDLNGYILTQNPWNSKSLTFPLECLILCGQSPECIFISLNNVIGMCNLFDNSTSTWTTQLTTEFILHYEVDGLNIQVENDAQQEALVCDTDGYVTIAEECFKVHEENRTFSAANATCVLEGGRMAVLDTPDKFLGVNNYIRSNHTSMVGYLLGLSDIDVEGEWRWTDGSLIDDYPVFNGDQPNDNDRRVNSQGADCGYASVVHHNMHKAIDRLYDDHCDIPATFVCERVLKT